jgi:nicotinamidase-related amidase
MIRLPLRFTRQYPQPGEEADESGIVNAFAEDTFEASESALVLVDIRNVGLGPDPLHPEVSLRDERRQAVGVSLIERSRRMVEDNIIPAVAAARSIGIPIIHEANTPLARALPQFQKWYIPDPPNPHAGWPPPGIAAQNDTEHFNRRFGEDYAEKKEKVLPLYDLVIPIESNDYVVCTTASAQKVLKHLGATNIFYMGFLLNSCIMEKGAGFLNMRRRGYKIVVFRDCTTGLHNAETLEGLWADKAWLEYVEVDAYTATAVDFIKACEA